MQRKFQVPTFNRGEKLLFKVQNAGISSWTRMCLDPVDCRFLSTNDPISYIYLSKLSKAPAHQAFLCCLVSLHSFSFDNVNISQWKRRIEHCKKNGCVVLKLICVKTFFFRWGGRGLRWPYTFHLRSHSENQLPRLPGSA